MEQYNAPKWFGKKETTRDKSTKQEKRLAKDFGGKVTKNSGATFGENDVVTPEFEIEAKVTDSSQFVVKMDDIRKMERKANKDKTPIFVIEFRKSNREFVMIGKEDFLALTKKKEI